MQLLLKTLSLKSEKSQNGKIKILKEIARREGGELFDEQFLYELSKIKHDHPVEVSFLFKLIDEGIKSPSILKRLFYSGLYESSLNKKTVNDITGSNFSPLKKRKL